jgi:glutathione S-transferase
VALRLSSLSYTVENRANPAAFRHLHPGGQVPILLAGERVVADSSEILRFIQTRTHALTLSNERDDACAWQWEDYADSNLSTFVTAARWADNDNWLRTKQAYFAEMPRLLRAVVPALLRRRVLGALQGREGLRSGYASLWESFARTLDRLERLAPLGSSDEPFWLGHVSVADAALYGHLQALRTDLTPSQRDEVERRPRLCAYLNRVHDAAFGAAKGTRAAR